jgi:transcription antitermination factor NusG
MPGVAGQAWAFHDSTRQSQGVREGRVITGQNTGLAATDRLGPFSNRPESAYRTAHWQPRWYAAYTRANHERRAHEQFVQRSIDSFLPTYPSVRHWKDRRVRLEMPLFPGYVFVHIPLHERLRVLEVPNVARLVGFGGMPVALNDEEVECLRRALAQGAFAQPHPYLTAGRRVRVTGGPLQGAEGTLISRKGNFRVILSVDLIKRSVIVDVNEADLEPVFRPQAVRQTAPLTSAREVDCLVQMKRPTL